MPGHSSLPCADYVDLSAMPGIHVLTTNKKDGDGRDEPGHDGKYFGFVEQDDPPPRNPDRTDRDPDVVAAGGTDGGDRKDSRVSIGGDDVCDRRADGISDMDRAARRDRRVAAAASRLDRRGPLSVRGTLPVVSRTALPV